MGHIKDTNDLNKQTVNMTSRREALRDVGDNKVLLYQITSHRNNDIVVVLFIDSSDKYDIQIMYK